MKSIEQFAAMIGSLKADIAELAYAVRGFEDHQERAALRAQAHKEALGLTNAFADALRLEWTTQHPQRALTIAQLERTAELCEAEGITLQAFIAQWKLSEEVLASVLREEAWRTAASSDPRASRFLVRILDTFEADSTTPDPELVALRGRLCKYLGTTDPEGQTLLEGYIAFGYNETDWAIADGREFEWVASDDESKVRLGDRVSHFTTSGRITSRVVRINNGNPTDNLRTWTLELFSTEDNTGKTFAESAHHCTLVSSDTPLG